MEIIIVAPSDKEEFMKWFSVDLSRDMKIEIIPTSVSVRQNHIFIFPRHEGKTAFEFPIEHPFDDMMRELEESLLPTLEEIREKKRQKFQRRKHERAARNSKSKN